MQPKGIIIAGERSGVGKTTVTLALLAALVQQRAIGDRIQSFKVGPDYIDPMFHRAITGQPAYNLDPVLTSEAYVQQSYGHHGSGAACIVEGVMGLFDGASGTDDTASTAHIARLLDLPVVLVVDCSRMARSVAALVSGYRHFDPRVNIVGVILNRVGSDRHLTLLKAALTTIEIPIFGVLQRETDIELPSRHLGLVPTGELAGFQAVVDKLAAIGERCLDWPQLEQLLGKPNGDLKEQSDLRGQSTEVRTASFGLGDKDKGKTKGTVRVAIATSPAFNFYYPDNLAMLEAAGATLIPWDPMVESLPSSISGLYLGGGFPEVFAAQLADNKVGRIAVAEAIRQGLPTYAECGGLMYLCETLIDFDGKAWPMAGIIPNTVEMGGRLSLGYRRVQTLQAGPLLNTQARIVGHEFHRSRLVQPLKAPIYTSERCFHPDGQQLEGWGNLPNVHASYVHLHWGSTPGISQRFVAQCRSYGNPAQTSIKP